MKIKWVVSQWGGHVINYISRIAQKLSITVETPVREQELLQEELHNGNVDEHEYVMNYR